MKNSLIISVVIIGILIPGVALPADSARTVKVGYIEFPPVFSTNTAGKPEGVLIDLTGKVLEKAGYNWNATSFPVKRMARNLVTGDIDLWVGLATLPVFQGKTLIGDSEVLKITLQSYTIGVKPPIKSKESLSGKKIIIIKGYSYGGWINYITNSENSVAFTGTQNHTSAFKMLQAGRADYLLNYKLPSDTVLKKMAVPNLHYNTISQFGAHFVVSKKTYKAETLLMNIERAYEQLVKDGEI